MLLPSQSISRDTNTLKSLILLDSPLDIFIGTLSLKALAKSVLSYKVRPTKREIGRLSQLH